MKMHRSRSLLRAVAAFAVLAVLVPASFSAAPDPAVDYPLERGADAGRQWQDKLGLNAEQVRRFTALENEKAARLKPLRELLRNGLVQLQAQLAGNAPESDVKDTLQQLLQVHRAIAERSEQFDAGLEAFLSPSQRAKLLVWQSLGGPYGYAARRLDPAAREEPRLEDGERD
ncbi:MAG: hypothetical protein PHS14_13450 [Elusimicrobia bacterium]|nr:hypothetical protein [Elusimicrobiota bacterium]